MRLSFKQIIICLLLLIAVPGFSQLNPPINVCTTVVDDVTVVVSWEEAISVPPDALYDLFRNNNDGGGWDYVGSVPTGSALQWDDFAATPELGPVSYYLITYANDIGSEPSDTVSTLFLELNSVIGSLNSAAQLDWNAPKSDTSLGAYNVYRQIDGEPTESLIATLPNSDLTYRDTLFGLCVAQNEDPIDIKYYVTYVEASCEMSSQTTIDGFQDLLGPEPPEVETVLIDPISGDAIIYWYPSPEPDLDEYLIQSIIQEPDGTFQYINLAFIQASNPTEYVYIEASSVAPSNMVVIAFDICGNDLSFDQIYTTMFLDAEYTSCDQFADLNWNPYLGWEEGVSKYIIHVDNGITTEDIELGPEELNFQLEVIPNLEYCVYVEAISNGTQRPSTTNSACFITDYPEVIDFAYNSTATTTGDRQIEIDLFQDISGKGTTYELLRSEAGQSYQSIGVYPQSTNPIITATDNDVDAQNLLYRYKWRVFDGCGQELFETNESNNIILRATGNERDLINTLEWNSYEDWEIDVESYEVYRKLGSEQDYSLLTSLSPSDFSYQDDIEGFLENEGEFCYKVVAVETENSFGFQAISESNISCATQKPLMWIPNTIVINGANQVFMPVAGFIDFTSYEMEVFNKWGERLFYTNDINVGWDGHFGGSPVREDMYQYVIVYRDGSGQPFVDQGPLYVLKANQ